MYLIFSLFLFVYVLLKLGGILVGHLFFSDFYPEFKKYRERKGKGHTYTHFLFLFGSFLELGFYFKMLANKKFRRRLYVVNPLVFICVVSIIVAGIFVFSGSSSS